MSHSMIAASPAPRPPSPAAAARREAILAVAHDIFLEHGFDGASMSQVAARLGGSKGTLYHYFDSKEALFEALVSESCARNSAAIFDAPDGAAFDEHLACYARRYIALVFSDWAIGMFRIVAAAAQRRPEVGRLFYESGPMAALGGLAARFAAEMATGRLAPGDPHAAAEAFSALCRGTLHLRRLLDIDPQPDAALVARLADRAASQFLAIYGR